MSAIPARIVELAKQRDPFCVRCGRVASHTHHRMMRSQAPKNAVHRIENVIRLCHECHGWVHAHPAESYERGWLVRSWSTPLEEPVTYPGGGLFFLSGRGTRIESKEQ